jgi:hypothetical protein
MTTMFAFRFAPLRNRWQLSKKDTTPMANKPAAKPAAKPKGK